MKGRQHLCTVVVCAVLLLCMASASLAVNDSLYIAIGCGIKSGSKYPQTPWPPRLDGFLSGISILNLGVSGSHAYEGRAWINGYLSTYNPGKVLILYGTNDIGEGRDNSDILWDLRMIIQAVKNNGSEPVIGTIPPFTSKGSTGLTQCANLCSGIRSLAADEGVVCADVFAAFNYDYSLLESDGLHPTRDGQILIALTFLDALEAAAGVTISPNSRTHDSSADTGSISVSADSSDSWTATTADSWVTVTSGSSGSGNGTVNYSITGHTGMAARVGTITIDTNTFTITQTGNATNFALASNGATITGSNGADWDRAIDGIYDNLYFGTVMWRDPDNPTNPPGYYELTLATNVDVYNITIQWRDKNDRYYQYYIESSSDGTNWTTITDCQSGEHRYTESMDYDPPEPARYLRLHGTLCVPTNKTGVSAVEWEVWGMPGTAPLSPFESWAESHAPSGQQGPNDDPDGDGIVNFMEFALGGDNSSNDYSRLPQLSWTNGTNLVYSFMLGQDADVVQYTIQFSDGFGSWTTIPPYRVSNSLTAGTPIEYPVTPMTQTTLGIRLSTE
jgi:lysophospholipase L1-like esterase